MEQNFELNKQAFGAFLAQLRREKGWTQKDLAEKLYVSDKAVSKWERGLSVPDVSLLLPLAELLGVSVTELLEGRRLEEAAIPADEVEVLVKKALTLPTEPAEVKQERVKKVSADVSGLQRAGCGRSTGRLATWVGIHAARNHAAAGLHLWRSVRGVFLLLD